MRGGRGCGVRGGKLQGQRGREGGLGGEDLTHGEGDRDVDEDCRLKTEDCNVKCVEYSVRECLYLNHVLF